MLSASTWGQCWLFVCHGQFCKQSIIPWFICNFHTDHSQAERPVGLFTWWRIDLSNLFLKKQTNTWCFFMSKGLSCYACIAVMNLELQCSNKEHNMFYLDSVPNCSVSKTKASTYIPRYVYIINMYSCVLMVVGKAWKYSLVRGAPRMRALHSQKPTSKMHSKVHIRYSRQLILFIYFYL